jgi:hypothetical protein
MSRLALATILASVLTYLSVGSAQAKEPTGSGTRSIYFSPPTCMNFGRKQSGGLTLISNTGGLSEELVKVPLTTGEPPAKHQTRMDVVQTIRTLAEKSRAVDEFETAAQRYARLRGLASGQRSILISPRAMNDRCDSFKYDAEAGRLRLMQYLAHISENSGLILTLAIAFQVDSGRSYLGQNSFGARAEVNELNMTHMYLRFINLRFSPLATPRLTDEIELPGVDAREIVPRLLYRVTYEPALDAANPTWVTQKSDHSTPTISEPYGGSDRSQYLATNLVRFELLDPVTGRVYGTYSPTDFH